MHWNYQSTFSLVCLLVYCWPILQVTLMWCSLRLIDLRLFFCQTRPMRLCCLVLQHLHPRQTLTWNKSIYSSFWQPELQQRKTCCTTFSLEMIPVWLRSRDKWGLSSLCFNSDTWLWFTMSAHLKAIAHSDCQLGALCGACWTNYAEDS